MMLYIILLMQCLQVSQQVKIVFVLLIIYLLASISSLLYGTFSRRYLLDHKAFPNQQSLYLLSKFIDFETQIYMTCFLMQILNIISVMVSIISIIIIIKQLDKADQTIQKYSLFNVTYVSLGFSLLAKIVVFGYNLSIKVEIEDNDSNSLGDIVICVSNGICILFAILIIMINCYNKSTLHKNKVIQLKYTQTQTPQNVDQNSKKPKSHIIFVNDHPQSNHVEVRKGQIKKPIKKNYVRTTTPTNKNIEKQIIKEVDRAEAYSFQQSLLNKNEKQQSFEECPDLPVNVVNVSNSNKSKKNIPKLRIEMIKKDQNQHQDHYRGEIYNLEISNILPKIKSNKVDRDRENDLSQNNSILSQIHEGKIPQEVENKSRKNLKEIKGKLKQNKKSSPNIYGQI